MLGTSASPSSLTKWLRIALGLSTWGFLNGGLVACQAETADCSYADLKPLMESTEALTRDAHVATTELAKALTSWQKVEAEGARLVAVRQLALLSYVYPLQIMLCKACYGDGAHTPESERYFMDSVQTLEKVRDLDANSVWGKRAHQERERLRQARLQAG